MFYNSYCAACDQTQTFIRAGVYRTPRDIHGQLSRWPLPAVIVTHDRCTYCQTAKQGAHHERQNDHNTRDYRVH